jgi:FkbM family methyltransferase
MMRSLAGRIIEHGGVLNAHVTCFGAARGASLFTVNQLRAKSRGRRINVAVPGSDASVALRLGTSDIRVFHEIFGLQEYSWKFTCPPRVIVDAGGYTGLSAAFFATRYPEAKIIAIEPDEQNFEMLALNTAQFKNVHPVHAALWMESGSIRLSDPGEGSWAFRVEDTAAESTASAQVDESARPEGVRSVTVNEIITEFNLEKVDLLKIDVEGSEKEIFSDSKSWISAVDAICIELHDRFKAGCSRSFFGAVEEFPIELRRGENVALVARTDSRLVPITR